MMATVFEEVQELKGGVKDELPTWSLMSPRMKAQVGAGRTTSWMLKIPVKPGSEPGGWQQQEVRGIRKNNSRAVIAIHECQIPLQALREICGRINNLPYHLTLAEQMAHSFGAKYFRTDHGKCLFEYRAKSLKVFKISNPNFNFPIKMFHIHFLNICVICSPSFKYFILQDFPGLTMMIQFFNK